MDTTPHQTMQDTDVTRLLAELGGVADRLVTAVAAAGEVRMATAGSILTSIDRLTAAVIEVLSKVTRCGVIADEGITVDAWLRAFASRTVADEKMLLHTVERLGDMPNLWGWFAGGEVSWPAVRGIVAAVANLTRTQRAWVDATLADDHGRVRCLDAEELVGAVGVLADRARPDLHRERERRAQRDERVWWQEAFDGWINGHFHLGPESADVFRRAMAATNPPNTTAPDDGADHEDRRHGHDHERERERGDGDTAADPAHADADVDPEADVAGDDGDGYAGWRRKRGWSNAKALVALCRQRLGLPGGWAPSAARPSLIVLADVNALTGDGMGSATAQLVTLSRRGPVELTSTALQRLACDATWRIVFTDGDEILGASAAHPKVSATLRAALVARDGGCRFPACRQPVELCENHHVIRRSDGGPTGLENLIMLCSAHHHAVHDSHWVNTLHADGTVTFTRHGTTITSVPRARQRLHPSTPPPPGRPARRRRIHPARPVGGATATAVDPDPPPTDLPF